MKTRSTRESARTLPRKWIEENWGVVPDPPRVAAHRHDPARIPAGRPRKTRPRTAPTARRETNAGLEKDVDAGRKTPHGIDQQQQPQHPRYSIRLAKAFADGDFGGVPLDSWGRGRGPSFAPRGVGPTLDRPRPPKAPTRPRWPTRSVEASVLRYIRTVHREKEVRQGQVSCVDEVGRGPNLHDGDAQGRVQQSADCPGTAPTVAWPEHAEMEKGDVIVTVEHCHSCHRHRMTTRHDPEVYLRHANAVKGLLIESLRDSSIRLAVILKKAPLRPKPSPSSRDGRCCSATASARRDRRVGAFEVQVAARHPGRAHGLHAEVIHSKLASGRWPRTGPDSPLSRRAVAALESWGFETCRRPVDGGEVDTAGTDVPVASPLCRPPHRKTVSWEFDRRRRTPPHDATGLKPQDVSSGHRVSANTPATISSASKHRESSRPHEAPGSGGDVVGTPAEVVKLGSQSDQRLSLSTSASEAAELAGEARGTARGATNASPSREGEYAAMERDGACDDVDDDDDDDDDGDDVLDVGDQGDGVRLGLEPEGKPFDEERAVASVGGVQENAWVPGAGGEGAPARTGTDIAAVRADVPFSLEDARATGVGKHSEGEREDGEHDHILTRSTEKEETKEGQPKPHNGSGGDGGIAVVGGRQPSNRNGGENSSTGNDSPGSACAQSDSGSVLRNVGSAGSREAFQAMADVAGGEAVATPGRGEEAQFPSDSVDDDDRGPRPGFVRHRDIGAAVRDGNFAEGKGTDRGHHRDASCGDACSDGCGGRSDDGDASSASDSGIRETRPNTEAVREQEQVRPQRSGCSSESPRSICSGDGDEAAHARAVDDCAPDRKEGKEEDNFGTVEDDYESDFGSQGGDSSVEDAMVPSAIEATLVAEPPKESLRGNANRSARADFGDLEVMDGRAQTEEEREEGIEERQQQQEEEEEEEEEEEYGDDFDDDDGDFHSEI